MGQHYIPQYYLKGFCYPQEPSYSYVYEKGKDTCFRAPIKTIANEKLRWPEEVETYLAEKIEAPANPILNKIRNHQQLTNEDKDILSSYMVVMLQRVDEGFKRKQELAPSIIEDTFNHLNKIILELIERHPEKKSNLEKSLADLQELKPKYEKEMPKELWYYGITPDTPLQVRFIMRDMTWNFFTTNKWHPFLTCDNPVFFFKYNGIGSPDSEITFPISSTVALWATWNRKIAEGYIPAREPLVREINRRTTDNATRWVYGSIKENWVVSLINKKHLKHKRIT